MANSMLLRGQKRPEVDLYDYNYLQIKYLQAENTYNKFLLKLTNMIMDNVNDFENSTQDELNKALEKARTDFEQIQEAIDAEKAYIEIKQELDAEQGKVTEEFKTYFLQ